VCLYFLWQKWTSLVLQREYCTLSDVKIINHTTIWQVISLSLNPIRTGTGKINNPIQNFAVCQVTYATHYKLIETMKFINSAL
jgi:hypothetical protein